MTGQGPKTYFILQLTSLTANTTSKLEYSENNYKQYYKAQETLDINFHVMRAQRIFETGLISDLANGQCTDK